MVVQTLTKHFQNRWIERCGYRPVLDEVNKILESAQKIRAQKEVRESKWLYRKWKILAEYWHNELGLIVRVDEERKRAVTVITWNGGNGNGERA